MLEDVTIEIWDLIGEKNDSFYGDRRREKLQFVESYPCTLTYLDDLSEGITENFSPQLSNA